jgi:hypothetical protein
VELVNYEWRYEAACYDNWRFVPEKYRAHDEPAPGDTENSVHVIDAFFPPRDKDLYTEAADYAKTFCTSCPVKARCLWDAIERDEPHGIWGGFSHRERNAIVRKWTRSHKNQLSLKNYVLRIGGKYGTKD